MRINYFKRVRRWNTDKPKLNYRFHNPNRTNEELTRVLLRTCIDANRKKAEEAIRECAMSDGTTYRVIAVDESAKISESGEKTLFRMPKGKYEGKGYIISNRYIKRCGREYALELPQGYGIEFTEPESGGLSLDEFVKEVAGKTAVDYKSPYLRPSEVAAENGERNKRKGRGKSRDCEPLCKS